MRWAKKMYLSTAMAVSALIAMAAPAFAVGTSVISYQSVVDDVVATLTANLTLALAVLSITIGAPVALRLVRRLVH